MCEVAVVDGAAEYYDVCFLGLGDYPVHVVSVDASSGGFCPACEAACAAFDV